MKLPAYPRTKPSGVEWLGDVPENWEVKRSDAIVSADRSQLSPEAFADRDVFHYSIPVVQETGTGQVENGESIASAKQVVKKPVVLVSKLNPRKATICLAKPQAILTLCSTEFVALNADRCDLAFLEYLTRSELFRQGLDSKVQSVTRSHQRANPADIYKFWNAWPRLEDQRSIAAFLDRETGRVDRLVAKKRELIERLKEKRTALISRTVTRGLPPAAARAAGLPANPPLKPSGIEWIGEVPKHWTLKRVGDEFQFISYGFTNPMPTTNEGPRMVTANDVNNGRVLLESARCTEEVDFTKLTRKSKPRRRDILVTKDGTLGRVGVVESDEPFCINQSVALLRPKPLANERFIAQALQSPPYFDRMVFEAGGTTIKHIYITRLARMPFGAPPLPEQAAIAAYLDLETVKLDALVGKVEEAVERLQEYRTALITAAVTGKIDVRKEVAHA